MVPLYGRVPSVGGRGLGRGGGGGGGRDGGPCESLGGGGGAEAISKGKEDKGGKKGAGCKGNWKANVEEEEEGE